MSYYKTFFFDSFEEDLSQWTVYHEGDPESSEWGIENPHDNSADLNAHSGYYAAVAYSDFDVHADSWLVTPQIQLPNQTTLKFWIMRSTYDDAQDEYEVRLSTTGNAISDFTTVLKEKAAANPYWTEVSIDLSQYDGQQCYIAIRHDYTGGFFIMVDDFGIFGWSEDIVTTADSLLIEDLLPETEYQWRVQANCGEEDGLSQWSAINNFTTLSTCPVPFGLSASNETTHGATLDWNGLSDNYLVMVAEKENIVEPEITYDFEDGWQGWTTFQGNTTSPNSWMHNTEYPTSNNDFSTGYGYNNSNGFMLSESYISGMSSGAGQAVTPDNYLVSPRVRLGGSISFYAGARNISYCAEKFSVMVSTTDNTTAASFTTVATWTLSLSSAGYNATPYTVDLSAYSGMGYIAIRHWDCYDQWFLAVDNVTIVQGSVETPWLTYEANESPFLLNDATNILPETTYLVKVKGFCEDEETDFCEPITFTTTVTCLHIDSLSLTNLTTTSVNLSWVLLDETQTAWQICLNGDESNLITADTNEDFLLQGLAPETEYTVKVRAYCGENDYSSWSNTITFATLISCYPVDLLSYDNLTSFSVNLSWVLQDETQTAWQICLNGDESNLIDANTNEGFLLDGLEPNVEYTVKVRAYCDENDYSSWSDTVTFTTPEVCFTPKNLAANNITAVSSDLSWTGREDVESYTVRYRTMAALENG